jgi:hypothetical protein
VRIARPQERAGEEAAKMLLNKVERDYLRINPLPDAQTALRQIAGWSVMAQPRVKKLLVSSDHSVDGTMMEASMKKLDASINGFGEVF